MCIEKFKLRIKETKASIFCEKRFYEDIVKEVLKQRKAIENYIFKDKEFLLSLFPYKVKEFAPRIAKEMAFFSSIAGVGPMASVAGAIAYYAVKKAVEKGSKYVVFENGGDIALLTDREINVGIFSGQKYFNENSKNIAIKIKPENKIIGICTSSGKMGHSLSFGKADTVTVIAENPILADAMATSICNHIKTYDDKQIKNIMQNFMMPQINTIIVIIGNKIGICGKVPEITFMNIPYELITTA